MMNKYMKMSVEELEAMESDFRCMLDEQQLHTDADRLDRAAAVDSLRKIRLAIDKLRHPGKYNYVPALY